jgi:signal transduction histidine kinase
VKHVVQRHGGTVEAQSELGKGTTISVLLPIR